MPYYAFIPRFEDTSANIDEGPDLSSEFSNWLDPVPWTIPVPEPLPLIVDQEGELLPYYRNPFPVMKKNLLKAIRAAGVENIDDYAVTITNPFDDTINNDYRALNIIGAIEAIDETLSESEEIDLTGSGLAGKFYNKIILDESKVKGQLLFQLAEKLSYIVIDESIKKTIEAEEEAKYFIFEPLFEQDDD